jgi:hypothetical protein
MSLRHSRPVALVVLRSRAWRPLLLAFALLAVWAQILSPARAMPHAAASAAALCLPSDIVRSAAQDEAPAVATDAPGCPFCRLPEPPASLLAEPPVPPPAPQSRTVRVRAHDPDAPALFVAFHRARGPPLSERPR